MSGGIRKVMNYALSDEDIRNCLGDDIKINVYPDLAKCRSIDELFDSKGRAILLYLVSSETSGHWVCLMKKNGRIEFFDPYGDAPEETKKYVNPKLLDKLKQTPNYLLDLLAKSEKPVFYNTHPFQSERSDVATCGRHCITRLAYLPFTTEKYKSIIDRSGLTPDKFVCGFVYDKIKK
jgi:hypothetical protein